MKFIELLRAGEKTSPTAEQAVVGKVITTTLWLGFTIPQAADVHAACGATINGRAMTVEECLIARQVYGYAEPGHYLRDARGNWA